MSVLKGFFHPRSATGEASLIPAPPWYYSGDLLTVEFRTDPARIAELLPTGLALAPEDPGAVALIWADWQSCSTGGAELLDPVRAQYKECFAVVRCLFEDRLYSRCVHIWVDKDFALLRGIHQGYPKKLGAVHLTRAHPFGRAAPRIAEGGRFGASLAANDRRLAEAIVTLTEPTDRNGFVNAHPMAHSRWLPAIDGRGDAFAELIHSGASAVEGGTPWRARVDHFALFDAPGEELARLEVREIIAASYRQVGVEWAGGRRLAVGLSGSA